MQVLSLQDRRNYDPSIVGLSAGKAQRYFAFDGLNGSIHQKHKSHAEMRSHPLLAH
jgi:hypothetical protein